MTWKPIKGAQERGLKVSKVVVVVFFLQDLVV